VWVQYLHSRDKVDQDFVIYFSNGVSGPGMYATHHCLALSAQPLGFFAFPSWTSCVAYNVEGLAILLELNT